MFYLAVKAAISGVLVAAVSETAKRSPAFGALIASLPMFLVMPWMLRAGFNFWLTLAASCALTVGLYLLMAWTLSKFGIVL